MRGGDEMAALDGMESLSLGMESIKEAKEATDAKDKAGDEDESNLPGV